ncbi:TSC22 domain family protein 1 isoform X1 [Rhinatrema bivittatum]|uniref:TSC22 domain family protein 1 isoform X1 n=2 Tax=Rhinatrema bivittatum TaxID=194408 RepID=UPI00112C4FFD|nr:TSC22 domain family protein 1 isoform X1 [Rhinatrema bivittatum]
MHQPDSSAEISARKMAHPAVFPRRGSSTSSVSSSVLNAAGSSLGGNAGSSEDYPPPLLIQPPLSAASSSSGPPQQHPQPPQSLNLLSQSQLQPQPLLQSGAQMKKKSGFQITSVTSAQISASMSSNNSIAEDTESYDDLDESHTEDLSSSEILDVSLSRATDLGEPGRSSSEETLNNFQEVETPGAVSPNQPRLPHHHLPAHSQQNVMINGTVHPHQHHGHQHLSHPGIVSASVSAGSSSGPVSGKLSMAGSAADSVLTVPGTSVSSAGTPAPLLPNIRSASTGGSIGVSLTTNALSNATSMSGVNTKVATNMLGSHITSTVNVNAMSGAVGNVNITMLSSTGNGTSASSSVSNAANASVGTASGSVAGQQQLPSASTSRFRVVKLDSSSEPFKKGRWTCTEYYEKENVAVVDGVAVNKTVESVKQNPLDVSCERESTSGSSVSSNVSTLSHYTESVGSGEMGAPSIIQQQAFQGLGPPQIDILGLQSVSSSGIPQSVSQSQLAQVQLQSQEVSYSQQKQVQHAAQASLNTVTGVQSAPVNIINVPSSLGHQQPPVSTMAQQLSYSQQTQSVQTLSAVPQQQIKYVQQQQTPAAQMSSGHVMPVTQSSATGNMQEYLQHPPKLQTSIPSLQPGPTGTVTPVSLVQAQSMQLQIQPTAVQAQPSVATTQPIAHTQATMPSVAASGQILGIGQQRNIPPVVQQPSAVNQASTAVMQQSAPPPPSQVLQPPQPGVLQQGMQVSVSSLLPQVIMAPPNPLLPVQPQTQTMESVVQGVTSQQIPAVSPIPPAAGIPAANQVSSSVPAGIPSAPTVLGPSLSTAQSSAGQNGNLVQSVSQPPIIATSLSVAQNVPQQIPLSSAHFPVMSLSQSMATRIEEARCLMEHSVAGLPQAITGDGNVGVSATLDGSSSSSSILAPGSLLPLKALPLSTPLVDGEDESSSGASVVAIDNKIEQAMDLVKSHLMYAVREEVEVLKEQIKELIEKNSQLEQENSLLKTLASPEQLAQFQAQLQTGSPPASSQPPGASQPPAQPVSQASGSTA